ncbi:MAG: hypothetical protein JXQ23_12285 [Clostridia bacterium]|nr:hypothetical protein [Clostridia bacterium]
MGKDMIGTFKKHTMYLKSGVSKLDFKRVFICDDRISAGIGLHGLTQMSYHGTQPVSRNAYIVRSQENEAFTFHVNHRKVTLKNLFLSSYGFLCENNHHLPLLYGFASHKSIILMTKEEKDELEVTFDESSLFSNVHGSRTWDKVFDSNQLIYTAHDHYGLKEWVDENGCFLVNMKDHNRLFSTGEGVDANNSDEPLKVNYSQILKDEMIFDSHLYMTVHRINSGTTCISFGDSMTDLRKERNRVSHTYRHIINHQISRYEKLLRKLPIINFDKFNALNEMTKMIPFYAESVKLSNKNIIRASASDYYWVWGWDSLVSLNEFSKWNDLSYQKKAIEFYCKNKLKDGSIPHRWNRDFSILQSGKFGYTECLFACLVFDVYLKTKKKKILSKYYNDILQIFYGLSEKKNQKGFICGLGVYPDSPHKLGRNNESLVAMDNAAYYLLNNILNEIAVILKDKDIIKKTGENIAFYDMEYLPLFYDSEKQSLNDHVDKSNLFNVKTYPSYSYIANYNRYGQLLYYTKLKEISQFFVKEYMVPNGVRNLPVNDVNVLSEPIHNSWYPHWDIYVLKYLRLAGRRSAVKGYLDSLTSMWERCACIMELLDLRESSENDGRMWQGHGQPWNLNCATAVYKTVFDSVVGIIWEHDFLTVMENGIGYHMNVNQLKMGTKTVNVEINKGTSVIPKITINKKEIMGSLKLPAKWFNSRNNTLVVDYDNEQQNYPVILESWLTEIKNISITDKTLTANVESEDEGKLLVFSKQKPVVLFNGNDMDIKEYGNDRYLVIFTGKGELKVWEKEK